MHAEIDADAAVGVFMVDAELCVDNLGFAEGLLVEEVTGRPILGYIFLCALWPGSTLAYTRLLTHETVHLLVRFESQCNLLLALLAVCVRTMLLRCTDNQPDSVIGAMHCTFTGISTARFDPCMAACTQSESAS